MNSAPCWLHLPRRTGGTTPALRQAGSEPRRPILLARRKVSARSSPSALPAPVREPSPPQLLLSEAFAATLPAPNGPRENTEQREDQRQKAQPKQDQVATLGSFLTA